jgi:uncharacterized membrane protein
MGHIIGGSVWWIPHHWILGLLLMIAPLFFTKLSWKLKIIIILCGLGLLISDFNDFLAFRLIGADTVKIIKFWGTD